MISRRGCRPGLRERAGVPGSRREWVPRRRAATSPAVAGRVIAAGVAGRLRGQWLDRKSPQHAG
jgi:hypothetical protein